MRLLVDSRVKGYLGTGFINGWRLTLPVLCRRPRRDSVPSHGARQRVGTGSTYGECQGIIL